MNDKKLRELMNKLKDDKDLNKDAFTFIDEFSKRLDMEPSVEMNLSVADQAREKALISAYKTISKVLNGSKNGPELLSAIPIADSMARIAKVIEENRNMKATTEATLALGKIVEEATKNVPESNSGVGTIIGI